MHYEIYYYLCNVEKHIEIKGARANNLKDIDVKIPHGKITVITGVSGSGKSSLAFDTLYAEGQRRFIESMSSYARQFLGKLNKPEMDYIKGLSPTIAIQQKVISSNPRSTVGTSTEIYDYLKLLFAREGQTYSPISGNKVKKDTVTDVINYIHQLKNDTPFSVICPLYIQSKESLLQIIEQIEKEGFTRVLFNNKITLISDLQISEIPENLSIIVDRFLTKPIEDIDFSRISDSIQIAFNKGKGSCGLMVGNKQEIHWFQNRFELDGMKFEEPTVHLFTFNNPFGACKTCEGYGSILGIDPNLVIPDGALSVFQGAIHPWRSETMNQYLQQFLENAGTIKFPIHRPFKDLNQEQKLLLWKGNDCFIGLNEFFKHIESQTYKIQYRVLISRYRGKTVCPECTGTRLRGDAAYVKIEGKSIQEIVLLPIKEAYSFFEGITLKSDNNNIRKRLLPEITNRLRFLTEVGLGYLTLNRTSNSLSGGESQRIHLATSIGSSLVGSTYVLDEPSIGLHPRDTQKLIGVLKALQEKGNTVVIVEHEEEVMKACDHLIDIGPFAGQHGGTVVFEGDFKSMIKNPKSLTTQYLTEKIKIEVPKRKRSSPNFISIKNVHWNNLKDISVDIPMHQMVCITGVSGSGKSSLIKEIVYPGMKQILYDKSQTQCKGSQFSGDFHLVKEIEFIDQNPIGKSSRSNPITYIKAFDEIRELFAKQGIAKLRNYKPGFFSFNVEGGRCEVCEGEGIITVGMQFMADIQLQCETCHGKRYRDETLEVYYREKNIADILEMTIEECYSFFNESNEKNEQKIAKIIFPLVEVGLGYLKVGQSSSTMSGGEAQRIKLASFLSKGKQQHSTLFIFDEPTTGLHFYDIEKLLKAFNALLDQGHSIIVIEHNVDVIKCADWIIDLGPEGGDEGGYICFQGTPESIIKEKNNFTGKFLKSKFKEVNIQTNV